MKEKVRDWTKDQHWATELMLPGIECHYIAIESPLTSGIMQIFREKVSPGFIQSS